ncbi:MAG: molecular chaperone DnaK [Actinobacteria bacterium]|nr:molecular chaperone DnaK [Actinomycetota bacterium]
MAKAVGIDLGTTNSVIAFLEAGEPTVVPNAEGARTTPSVVAYAKSGGEILVGEVAKRQAITNPDRTVRSIKREMGRKDWSLDIDGKKWIPQEISAQILTKLKRDAEAYLGDKVTQAVVTVPAYFDDAQRQATKEAGEIAGLEVLRIINEPTAAALAYGLDKGGKEQTVLVFDLGGGTFDVSLLEIGEGVFEVKATHGDTHLGGDDWDQRVIDWLVTQFKNKEGVDLSKDRMALQRLKEAAEKAKIELSQTSETTINLPFVTATAEGPKHLEEKLSRAEFERMTADLVDRCRTPFELAIKDAGIDVSKIDHVILVGGSTRMPMIQELVRKLTGGKEPHKGVNPDEVVAVGAAIQAGVLKGEVKDVVRSLGKFQLMGIPPAPRGMPQVEVTFDIDANGIVNVSAKDLATGKQQAMTITGGTALPREDVDKMVREAEQFANEDRARRDEAETRNQADNLAYQAEKLIADSGDAMAASDKEDLQKHVTAAKEALAGTDIAAVKNASDALMSTFQRVGAAMHQHAQQAGQQEAPGTGGAGDVVDAEIVDEGGDAS